MRGTFDSKNIYLDFCVVPKGLIFCYTVQCVHWIKKQQQIPWNLGQSSDAMWCIHYIRYSKGVDWKTEICLMPAENYQLGIVRGSIEKPAIARKILCYSTCSPQHSETFFTVQPGLAASNVHSLSTTQQGFSESWLLWLSASGWVWLLLLQHSLSPPTQQGFTEPLLQESPSTNSARGYWVRLSWQNSYSPMAQRYSYWVRLSREGVDDKSLVDTRQ